MEHIIIKLFLLAAWTICNVAGGDFDDVDCN